MTEQGTQENGVKIKIDILLKEYDALRNEITNRINNRFNVVGLLLVLVAYTGSQSESSLLWRWIIAALAAVVVLVVWWRIGYMIKLCAVRIVQIEQRVNALAGEEVLAWESRIAGRTLFHFFYRKPPGL